MDYYRPGEGIQMMVSCAQQDIKTIKRENESLRLKVEELEEKNRRLEEARENANAACAKWEGLYRAELEKKPAWVSVRDRLPEDYQRVLCLFESGTMEVSFRASVKGFCYEGFKQTGKVTHWMPLPEPPKEE